MSRLSALLFDVDGTLADTERAHLDAFNKAFADAGLDWHWSVPLYTELLSVTGGKERIRYFIDRYLTGFRPSGDVDVFISGLHAQKTRIYVGMLSHGAIGLRPGVQRLFGEARAAGVRLAIATTTTPANVTALLESTLGAEALSWFELIGAGDAVPRKKPAPDIYLYVMERLGVMPQECIAFEDSRGGVEAACGAGLQTIVTCNDFTRDHDFTGAALVLDHLGEPDRPFTVQAGEVDGSTYVDMDLVRRIHCRGP